MCVCVRCVRQAQQQTRPFQAVPPSYLTSEPSPIPPRSRAQAIARCNAGGVLGSGTPHVGTRKGAARVVDRENAGGGCARERHRCRRPLVGARHHVKSRGRVHKTLLAGGGRRAHPQTEQPKGIKAKIRTRGLFAGGGAGDHAVDVRPQRRGGCGARARVRQRHVRLRKRVEMPPPARRRAAFQQTRVVAHLHGTHHGGRFHWTKFRQAAPPRKGAVEVFRVVETLALICLHTEVGTIPRRRYVRLKQNFRSTAAVPVQTVEKRCRGGVPGVPNVLGVHLHPRVCNVFGTQRVFRALVQRHALKVLDEERLFLHHRGAARVGVEMPPEHALAVEGRVRRVGHTEHREPGFPRQVVLAVQRHPVAQPFQDNFRSVHEGECGIVVHLRHALAVHTPADVLAFHRAFEQIADGHHKIVQGGVRFTQVVPPTVRLRHHVVALAVLVAHVDARLHVRFAASPMTRANRLVVFYAEILYRAT